MGGGGRGGRRRRGHATRQTGHENTPPAARRPPPAARRPRMRQTAPCVCVGTARAAWQHQRGVWACAHRFDLVAVRVVLGLVVLVLFLVLEDLGGELGAVIVVHQHHLGCHVHVHGPPATVCKRAPGNQSVSAQAGVPMSPNRRRCEARGRGPGRGHGSGPPVRGALPVPVCAVPPPRTRRTAPNAPSPSLVAPKYSLCGSGTMTPVPCAAAGPAAAVLAVAGPARAREYGKVCQAPAPVTRIGCTETQRGAIANPFSGTAAYLAGRCPWDPGSKPPSWNAAAFGAEGREGEA